jgi:uncharacterized protein YicC (UPF0701 family)
MAAPKKQGRFTMSADHKQALAKGREEGRAVRHYLEALEAHRPKRGRKRTPETIEKRLAAIEGQLAAADPLTRLQLVQERMNLQAELETKQTKVDLSALEREFVKAAKGYSERKGITYAAWRESGVDAAVLKKAGIGRGASG